jgi:hypothetical protein
LYDNDDIINILRKIDNNGTNGTYGVLKNNVVRFCGCLTMTTVTIIKIITDINKHTIVHHAPSNKDSLANVTINENTAVATTKIISTMDDVIDVELLGSSETSIGS